MCPKPIYCSKVTKKGKTCSRVLEPQKVAPNAKGCWKVTEHNRDRPTVILKRIWFILTFWSFTKNQFVCWHRTWPCTECQFRKLVFWANPLIIYQSRLTSRGCLKGWVHLISVQKSFSYFIWCICLYPSLKRRNKNMIFLLKKLSFGYQHVKVSCAISFPLFIQKGDYSRFLVLYNAVMLSFSIS